MKGFTPHDSLAAPVRALGGASLDLAARLPARWSAVVTLGASLLLVAGAPGLARADDPPPVTGSNSGLDQEEDDLLGGDLLGGEDAPAATPGVAIPPPELKRQIDQQITELAARSDAVGDELFVELAGANATNAEIERRIQEAEQRFRDLSAQLDKLSSSLTGEEPDPQPRGPRGYGTPVSIGEGRGLPAELRNRPYDPIAPLGPSDPKGRQQLKWWEKLVLQLASGVSDLLKVLAEKRTNALKAEGDAIALNTEPRYRPYVDAEVRKAIGNSALGSNLRKTGADPRLNDLSVRSGGNAAPQPGPGAIKSYQGAGAETPARQPENGPMPTRYLLELKRDPLTGVERPVVAIPLGLPTR